VSKNNYKSHYKKKARDKKEVQPDAVALDLVDGEKSEVSCAENYIESGDISEIGGAEHSMQGEQNGERAYKIVRTDPSEIYKRQKLADKEADYGAEYTADDVLPPNVEYVPPKPWVAPLRATIIGLAFVLLYLWIFGLFSAGAAREAFAILTDGFFVVGIVILCLGLLRFSSKHGSFDTLAYSGRHVATVFMGVFSPTWRSKHISYVDYVERRRERKIVFMHLIIAGGGFVALSVLFLIIHNSL